MSDAWAMMAEARASWAKECAAAPATLIPTGEKRRLGMAHMTSAAVTPPHRESANPGEKMPPDRSDPTATRETTTTRPQAPPKK